MARLTSDLVDPRSLGEHERARWREIQALRGFGSPFFTLAFSEIVAAARDDVQVAVLRGHDDIVGFFPFQIHRRGVGRPVGHKLSDYHGPLVDPALDWNASELLELSGLRMYTFDHLIADQPGFEPFIVDRAVSPFLDLSSGFDSYKNAARAAGLGGPKDADLQRRRLKRQAGSVRFVADDRDAGVFDALIRLKSRQYMRTGAFDVFSIPWVTDVLKRAYATRTQDFSGILSSLYVDGTLAAAHMGVRSRRVLHWWFPAYDVDFAKYSPGLVLLLSVAEAAARDGLRMLDLGSGRDPYKRRFATGSVQLAIGSVERDAASHLLRVSRRASAMLHRLPRGRRVDRFLTKREFR